MTGQVDGFTSHWGRDIGPFVETSLAYKTNEKNAYLADVCQ